jgi:hypothetical protein
MPYVTPLPRRPGRLGAMVLVVLLLGAAAAVPGCGRGQEVTRASIQEARGRWKKAAVNDYDLEWESTGLSRSHYIVKVRGGHVQKVEGVKLDGTHIALKPADPSFYSVDGLFTIMADELALLDTATPFGQPKGTTAVLRFTTDPKFGYLRTYRRDVMGAPSALAIDVLRFTPVAPRPRANAES